MMEVVILLPVSVHSDQLYLSVIPFAGAGIAQY